LSVESAQHEVNITSPASLPDSRVHRASARSLWGDRIFIGLTGLFALFVLVVLASIIIMLSNEAWPVFDRFGTDFFITQQWNVIADQYGALAPIVGTLVTSFIAVAIGVPISFGIAIFISLMAPSWLKRPVGIAIELLAAIPSIIYGMWGMFYFAPLFADHIQPWLTDTLGELPWVGVFFQGPPIGLGMFTAGMILAIMIIPFIASVMRDMFDVVPKTLRESAYAMGSTTWEVIWNIILPYTRIGVIGGIMLGLGRALGETMAVTFVIGNAHELMSGLFYPAPTIASTLANEFNEASGLHMSALIALGLILFMITFVVLAISRWLLMKLEQPQS
jgi:phosphate transport system permease protein